MTEQSTLHVTHVTKRYGTGLTEVQAVRDVSLEVMPGEILLIMGPSGSGKTTLLQMMGALLKPTEGTIHLNGEELSALTERRLPDIRLHQIGFIFQDFNLLSALSILDNVALVAELAGTRRSVARQRATALLTELGLRERLRFCPGQLSGGEKQRVSIARALVNDPALILADEPTDGQPGLQNRSRNHASAAADRTGTASQYRDRLPRRAHPGYRRSGVVVRGWRIPGDGNHGDRPGLRHES